MFFAMSGRSYVATKDASTMASASLWCSDGSTMHITGEEDQGSRGGGPRIRLRVGPSKTKIMLRLTRPKTKNW